MSRTQLLGYFLLLTSAFLLISWFHFRGLIIHDEGWFLYAGERLLQGEIIYKDFQFVYTPGLVYLTSLSYALFGVSVWSTRVLALLNSFVTLSLLSLIAKKLQLNFLSSTFLLLTFLFWGPAHINFIWPVMFCLTTGLATSTLFLYAESTDFNQQRLLLYFLSGVTTALTGLLKQNFGVALLITNCVFFLIRKSKLEYRQLIAHLLGMLVVAFFQISYLLWTNSFTSFIGEMWFITYEKIIRDGILNSDFPWNYPAPLYSQLFKVILYLSPLGISVISVYKFYFHHSKFLIHLSLLSFTFFLLSFRPTTDYIHLTPLLALSSVCLVIMTSEFKNYYVQLSISFLLSGFLFAGAYSALFRNYYGWDTPLIAHNFSIDHTRLGVTVDHKTTVILFPLIEYLEKEIPDEEHIFVYSFTPVIYFLSDKNNPTRYDYVHSGILTEQLQSEVQAMLLSDVLKIVITDHSIAHDQSLITNSILDTFVPVQSFGDYTVWRKFSL